MQIKHYHLDSVDSTQNWAKNHIGEFDKKELIFISADFQTAGKGRFNRRWISPPKENLLITFALWLGQFDFNLPQVLALAAADMLHERGFEIQLKWPNDLLLHGKKIGGLLCESIEEEAGRWFLLGIGLNLNMKTETLHLLERPATSLFIESGKTFDPENLARVLAAYFERSIAYYHGFAPFYSRFKEKLIHQPGDTFKIGHFTGQFKDLNHDGSITLVLESGEEKVFISGEIDEG